MPQFRISCNYFKIIFFCVSAISEWNKVDKNIANADNISTTEAMFGPIWNSILNRHPEEVKLLLWLRLGLSHLRKHNF